MNKTTPVQYVYRNQPPQLGFPTHLKVLESLVSRSVLTVRSKTMENRYHDAARALGNEIVKSPLIQRKFPETRYLVVGSNGSFRENYGHFHHLGLLVIPVKEKRKWTNQCLAVDPNHNAPHSGDRRVGAVFSPPSLEEVFPTLSRYYGGKWTAQYFLDDSGKYRFLDDETKIADYFLKFEDDLL